MDLSGLIFVALAVAWGCYLLPRAIRQTDVDTAAVDTSTDAARVLTRTSAMMRAVLAETEPVDPERKQADRAALKASEARTRAALQRPVNGTAAVRRRRILLVPVLATGLTAGAAGLSYLPWWSVAVPATLVAAWLVLCARMAKAERRRVVRPRAVETAASSSSVDAVEESVVETAPVEAVVEMVASTEVAVADRLWDPLPITLPTYVGKPVARRTARAIDLAGMTSSGHDAADSALARSLRTSSGQSVAPAEVEAPVEHRRAAGA